MRFIHIGDLHFGKMFYKTSLVEADQPYWVEQLLKAVDEYNVDAVVIAGDVYDRKDPSIEAMKLVDHMLTELAARDKYVFVIPGNHDSEGRLSYNQELLSSHKIYIAGKIEKELKHITVSAGGMPVTFWLMPYIFPKLVADEKVLNDPDITTYDVAARSLIAAQNIDKNSCNVLIAHQNVLANGKAPEHSDSETIIGGVGEIEVSAFEAFDYVALGHIHNAQKMGRETVRYSGCPLYYDFSEVDRKKDLTIVTINSKEDIDIQHIQIPLLHKMKKFTGTLEELLEEGSKLTDKDSYHIQCIITDKHIPTGALDKLRDVFGESLINVTRGRSSAESSEEAADGPRKIDSFSLDEQFSQFYQEQAQELMDEAQEHIIEMILEQQIKNGDSYAYEAKYVGKDDSQELLDYLIRVVGEENV